MRNYEVISADSHVEVLPDAWRSHVGREFQSYVPTVIKTEAGTAWRMPVTDKVVPLSLEVRHWQDDESSARPKEPLRGTGDGGQRLREMDADGIDAEVLFPALLGRRALSGIPPEASIGLTRGYNDWLSTEYCASDFERLLGVAMLPVAGLAESIAELRRAAALPGIRAVVLSAWPNGSGGPLPEDDEFWNTAIELGVPLTAHPTFGGSVEEDHSLSPTGGELRWLSWVMTTREIGPRAATQLINTGVLDRFEELRVFFAHSPLGAVSFCSEQLDDYYSRHRYWAGIDLPHDPSWYVKRHFKWGFTTDAVGLESRQAIGVDNILWSSRFPDPDSEWPNSRKLIDDQFIGIPDSERRRIVCDNALSFFHLGPSSAGST